MAIAIALILIVIAAVLFNFFNPWWYTPLASNWGDIDSMLGISLVVTGVVFAAVNGFVAYAIIRYRHRPGGPRAAYQPENKRLEFWLTVVTSIGIMALLAPGLFVYADFVEVPEDAHVVEVVGHQWQWSYRLPGEDGVLGKSHVNLMTADNPLGIDADDEHSADDRIVLGGDLHLPADQPTKILLRTKDVLHNFYVPQFRVKMDLVPGMVSHFWFTPTRPGRYEVLCAELCGVGHFNMRSHVVVEDGQQFAQWRDSQKTFSQWQSPEAVDVTEGEVETPLYAIGEKLFQAKGCVACHSVDGSRLVGPSMKDLFGWEEKLADGSSITVDEAYLRESILEPNARIVQGYPPVMPPMPLSDADMAALIAYIQHLSPAGDSAKAE